MINFGLVSIAIFCAACGTKSADEYTTNVVQICEAFVEASPGTAAYIIEDLIDRGANVTKEAAQNYSQFDSIASGFASMSSSLQFKDFATYETAAMRAADECTKFVSEFYTK